jgi:NAD(P)H-flavin reductase
VSLAGVQEAEARDSLLPRIYRVVGRRVETSDVVTLALEPSSGSSPAFRAGQFNMLCAFGVGEVAISISSPPGSAGPLEHTVRDVGAVTHALWSSGVGDEIGVRGPFGTDWGTHDPDAEEVVVVAGGIGLAPLRGAVFELLGAGTGPGALPAAGTWTRPRVTVLVGARTPDQIVFEHDLEAWEDSGARVEVTVDAADASWKGPVGVVTSLIAEANLDPLFTRALVCGPEVMMRFSARALLDKGLDSRRLKVSLERNMQCGVAMCGHCQLGPLLLCRDGPVVEYSEVVSNLMSEHEL